MKNVVLLGAGSDIAFECLKLYSEKNYKIYCA